MKPSETIESFTVGAQQYWTRLDANGRQMYAVANGGFKAAGSKIISRSAYQRQRRNPLASLPK